MVPSSEPAILLSWKQVRRIVPVAFSASSMFDEGMSLVCLYSYEKHDILVGNLLLKQGITCVLELLLIHSMHWTHSSSDPLNEVCIDPPIASTMPSIGDLIDLIGIPNLSSIHIQKSSS